jgi:hypothetical protein
VSSAVCLKPEFNVCAYCGIEINVVKKATVMRISRQSSPVQIMADEKQLDDVEYFNCLCSMITNNARCTCGIQYRISSIEQEEDSFHHQIGLKFKEETSEMLYW